MRYESKREPHFFYFGDFCTFCRPQKGKNMGRVPRKIERLYICLVLGMKLGSVIKTTENKVVTNTSRNNKSPCPFYLMVWFERNRLRIEY